MLLPLSGKFVLVFTCIHFQCAINPSNIPGLEHFKQELISRLDSRTLPFERRHRCASSVPSTCLRNDVLASRLQAAC